MLIAIIISLFTMALLIWIGNGVYRIETARIRRKRELAEAYREVAETLKDHPNQLVREYWQRAAALRSKDLPNED